MTNSSRRLIRTGAVILEGFSLFVVYSESFMVPFPYRELVGLIGAFSALSLLAACLAACFWDESYGQPRRTARQFGLTPPLGLWTMAIIPPAIRAFAEFFI
jgi:hypothetical protein